VAYFDGERMWWGLVDDTPAKNTATEMEFYKGERIVILDPKKLANMVIDAGLVDWLVRKVS
jgi:hypothetical protein